MSEVKFFEDVTAVLSRAQERVKTAVNLAMVYAYYEIGRLIVEEEQHGQDRAAYGTQLLKKLSAYLTVKFGKGYSPDNLKLMRDSLLYMNMIELGKTCFPNSRTTRKRVLVGSFI